MAIHRTFLAVLAAPLVCLSFSASGAARESDLLASDARFDRSCSVGFSLCSDERSLRPDLPSLSDSEGSRPAAPADDLDQLQSRFDKENDGGRKVKLLKKLAEAQIDQERTASQKNDFQTVGFTLEKYRDNLRAAFDALKRTHPNAVKKPGGYKRLEFENQRALREVEDTILVVPDAYKPPLQLVLADLRKMEDDLLHALFPNRPGEKPLPPAADPPSSSGTPKSKTPQEGEKNP